VVFEQQPASEVVAPQIFVPTGKCVMRSDEGFAQKCPPKAADPNASTWLCLLGMEQVFCICIPEVVVAASHSRGFEEASGIAINSIEHLEDLPAYRCLAMPQVRATLAIRPAGSGEPVGENNRMVDLIMGNVIV
jgi:hypothetical protein